MMCLCKTCGKETKKSIYYIKKFEGRVYCSKSCYYDSIRKPKIERICEWCKKLFLAYPSSVKYHGARFCSKACKDTFNHGERSYKWKRTERICLNCKNKFEIESWRLKNKNRGQFCNIECRDKYQVDENSTNWRGGITPENMKIRKSKEMQLWRQSVLERDNYTCVLCGSTKRLEVDHIKSFANYPELRTSISNGRVLCKPCHTKTDNFGAFKRNPTG